MVKVEPEKKPIISVEATVAIDRSPQEVFDFVVDPSNDPLWNGDVLEANSASGGPVRRGTTARWVINFMGRKEGTAEVTTYEPFRLGEVDLTAGRMSATFAYWLEAQEKTTLLTRRVDVYPCGMPAFVVPMVDVIVRRRNSEFLENLKSLLER